jgi:hypothetical protein
MVRLHFETLAPGMKARLDSPRRLKHAVRHGTSSRGTPGKPEHGSVNCMLADAVKMPYNRFKT